MKTELEVGQRYKLGGTETTGIFRHSSESEDEILFTDIENYDGLLSLGEGNVCRFFYNTHRTFEPVINIKP